MQQFAEKVGRTLDEFIDEAPGPDQSKIIDLTYVTDRFVTMGFPASPISASRGATAPSRHRRDSCSSDEVVGGFFFEFEAVRTASSAPRSRRDCIDQTQVKKAKKKEEIRIAREKA